MVVLCRGVFELAGITVPHLRRKEVVVAGGAEKVRVVVVVVINVGELVSRITGKDQAARGNVIRKHTIPDQGSAELVDEGTGDSRQLFLRHILAILGNTLPL